MTNSAGKRHAFADCYGLPGIHCDFYESTGNPNPTATQVIENATAHARNTKHNVSIYISNQQ